MDNLLFLLLGLLLMLLPPGEGGRSSSLSVLKVPDGLLNTEPTRERSDWMVDIVRPARESKSKSMGGGMVVG
jgi:hypothetical protein